MGIFKKKKDLLKIALNCRKENLLMKAERIKIIDIINNDKIENKVEKIKNVLLKRGRDKMLKINEDAKCRVGVDYVLEDGTELFLIDWNGEKYLNGYRNRKDTDITYRPVYDDNDEIIGFEEF